MAIVYRHIRLDINEVFYIGIGKSYKRAYSTKNRNKYWKNITNAIDYRVDILFDDLTWNEACEKEKEFISLYGRKDLKTGTLVNMTDGGEGANGAKRNYTDDNPSPLKGKKFTDEHRLKISEKSKLLRHSDDTKKKLSDLKKGTTHDRGNNLLGKKKPKQKERLLGSGKGYYFCNRVKKFIAKIVINGKSKQIGTFENELDAHNAYLLFYNDYKIKNK